MRAHGVALRVGVVDGLVARPFDHIVFVGAAAGFVQFAVQVQHGTAAGTFVQVVHVLGNNLNLIVFF